MLNDAQISMLCLKLAMLQHAGLSLGRSVGILKSDDKQVQETIQQMAEADDRGERLYEAMTATGKFPAYVTGLMETADMAGRTEDALRSLAEYYKQRDIRSRRIRSALLYPALLFIVMLGVVGVLLMYVMPVFDSVYAQLGGNLTGVAYAMLCVGLVLRAHPVVTGAIAAVLLGGVCVLAGFETARRVVVKALRGLLVRTRAHKAESAAKIVQSAAMGLGSGLTLSDAMDLAGKLVSDDEAAKRRCEECAEALNGDAPVAQTLVACGIMSEEYSELVSLGQSAGRVDSAVQEVSERMTEDAERALDATVSKIEPVIVFLSAGLIGLILLSVMLPLASIMTAIC